MSDIQKRPWWRRELWFIIGSVLYVLANCFDYYYIVWGMRVTDSPEGNPFLRFYMELFGVKKGLFISKLIAVCLVITLVKILLVRTKKLSKAPMFKKISYGLLYGAAAITVLAGSFWILPGIILSLYS